MTFLHVMPLSPVLVSHGTNGIKNNTISFFKSRKLNEVKLDNVMLLVLMSLSGDTDSIRNGTTSFLITNEMQHGFFGLIATLLSLDCQNEHKHDFFGHLTQLPLPLTLHGATGVTICHWHQCWCDILPNVSYKQHSIF